MRLASALALAVLALAGCGGGDDDAELAERSTLTLEDLPTAGWEPLEADDGLAVDCAGFEGADDHKTGHGIADFGGEGQWVLNRIFVFADEATAESVFGSLAADTVPVCFGEDFARMLEAASEKAETGPLTTEPLTIAQAGDDRRGARVRMPLTMNGQTLEMTIDLAFVRAGRAITTVGFVQGLAPSDSRLLDRLVATSVERMAERTT